jgi:hypothetical protein
LSVGLEILISPSLENMNVLHRLGVLAADLNVNSSDFVAKFDLQPR